MTNRCTIEQLDHGFIVFFHYSPIPRLGYYTSQNFCETLSECYACITNFHRKIEVNDDRSLRNKTWGEFVDKGFMFEDTGEPE